MAGIPGGFANGLSFLKPKRNIIATSLQKVSGISFERQPESGKPSYYMNFNNKSIPAITYRDGQISDPLAHDMERQMYDQFSLKWSVQELKNQDNLAIDESNKQIKLRDLFIYNASKISAIVNNVLEEEIKRNEENLASSMALVLQQSVTIDSILKTANESLDLSKKQTREIKKLSFLSSISSGLALAGILFSISKMRQYFISETPQVMEQIKQL
jgi:hypothetical protein